MHIREQIGYPDYILEDRNKHLDDEYSNVRPQPRGPQGLSVPSPHPDGPPAQSCEPGASRAPAGGAGTNPAPSLGGPLRSQSGRPKPPEAPPPPAPRARWPCRGLPSQPQGLSPATLGPSLTPGRDRSSPIAELL